PAFKFFKNGQQVSQLVDAGIEEFRKLIAQHVGSPGLNIQGENVNS
ncbi:22701_t:CDS:1, partial [Racocetra persica]